MAKHTTSCPHCGEIRNFLTQSAGTLQRCKDCGRKFRLPDVSGSLFRKPGSPLLGRQVLGGCLTVGIATVICLAIIIVMRTPAKPTSPQANIPHNPDGSTADLVPPSKPLSPEEIAERAKQKDQEEERRRIKEARLKDEAEAKAKAEEEARIKEEAEQAAREETLASKRLEAAKTLNDLRTKAGKFREIAERYPKTKAGEEARLWLEKNGK